MARRGKEFVPSVSFSGSPQPSQFDAEGPGAVGTRAAYRKWLRNGACDPGIYFIPLTPTIQKRFGQCACGHLVDSWHQIWEKGKEVL